MEQLLIELSPENKSHKHKALTEELHTVCRNDNDPKRRRADLAKELGPPASNHYGPTTEAIVKNVQYFGINAKQFRTAQHVEMEEFC